MELDYNKLAIVDEKNIRSFMQNFRDKLIEDGVSDDKIDQIASKFYTNNVRIRYSPDKQDIMWDNLMRIANEPGGIVWMCDNLDYFITFEHRRFRNMKSIHNQKPKDLKRKRPNNK